MSPPKVSDISDKRSRETKTNMHVRSHRPTLGRSEVAKNSGPVRNRRSDRVEKPLMKEPREDHSPVHVHSRLRDLAGV
jgi:hypothetical protein